MSDGASRRTMPGLLLDRGRRTPDRVAFRAKELGIYRETTGASLGRRVGSVALGFRDLGVSRGDTVAIMGDPCPSNVRLEPSLGVLGLKAFAVALVGGLDSLAGVLPAAVIVAAVEVLSIRYGDPLLSDVSPFLCLLAMLLVRPWRLFGTREELERV